MAAKGIQTRQTIITQALQLFCVKGYYNTSINDILEATGLTKGGLYGHFASKEDLWYAVYDEALSIWRAVVFRGIRSGADPLECILTLIESVGHSRGRSSVNLMPTLAEPTGTRSPRPNTKPHRESILVT